MDLRILDVLFNRLREGLRVLEDHARFSREDANLTSQLKEFRHHIRKLEEKALGSGPRQRRTLTDSGACQKAPSQKRRQDISDLVRANACRVQESLRSLEEHLSQKGRLSDWAEALRFQAYDLQSRLEAPLLDCRLYAIVTESLCSIPFEELIPALERGGVGTIQLREKNKSDRQILSLARRLKACRQKATLILNDRADLAQAAGFDGVHLGQSDIPPQKIREQFGEGFLIGLSTHSLNQVKAARKQAVDYIGIGPVFSTETKPHLKPLGLTTAKAMIRKAGDLKHVCIGGLNPERCAQLYKAGAYGVALCRGLIQVKFPEKISKKIVTIQV